MPNAGMLETVIFVVPDSQNNGQSWPLGGGVFWHLEAVKATDLVVATYGRGGRAAETVAIADFSPARCANIPLNLLVILGAH
jgi:hypothetical protein